ncbi:neuroglobin-like [Daphnia pulex]|uniref:neuroglobin-like n=1 Tax=Daphnia pulex TaxID=6669 RepID=UPI001EE092D3|nr:neuroglobin-like [Daphnia pulex]
MGCVQSQSNGQPAAKDKGGAAGGVINDNNGQGGASAVILDPRLPLNARQKYSMLASWKGISRALEPTGVYMFIKLFEEHKELLNLFTKFHKLTTRDEQASSEELAEHAVSVMTTLDESIRSLDNVDAFILYLHQVGQSHYKIPGFQKEYFWKIRNPFLEAVKMTLGDRYTDNIENIYKVSINLVIETLVEGYEKAHQQHLAGAGGPSS